MKLVCDCLGCQRKDEQIIKGLRELVFELYEPEDPNRTQTLLDAISRIRGEHW